MKILHIFYVFSLSFLLSCHSEPEEVVPEKPEEEKPAVPENLTWVEGFPLVTAGTHALKMLVRITKPGKVYYAISEKELENLTATQIKEMATSTAKPGDNSIIAGELLFNTENIDDTVSTVIEGLTSGKNYFSYYIAEGKEADSIYLLPDENIVISVSYLPSREKEEVFFSAVKGQEIKYHFYALEDYYLNPFTKYPLLIFLHGKGEYGDGQSLSFFKNGTIPELIHEGRDFPFVIVSPQIDTGRWDTDFVDEFIEYVIDKYNVDESRIYMTGNSLGGVGTWEYAGDYPDRLAAMVPISGHGDTLEACKFKDIPVWAFHNAEDGTVDTRGSIDMVEALDSCDPPGSVEPKLTIYPEEGHDAWIRTYDGSAGHDIYGWMLSYHKSG